MTDREEEDDLDELLQPTVAPVVRSGYKPWRVQSQFWVAFFGGVVAVTGIAYINSGHLGMPARSRWPILALGVFALAAYVAMAGWLFRDEQSSMRVAGRLLAVLLFLVLARVQSAADKRHQLFGSGEYAPLWGMGVAASIVGIIALVAIEYALK